MTDPKKPKKPQPKNFDLHKTRFANPHQGTMDKNALKGAPIEPTKEEGKKKRFTWKKGILVTLILLILPILIIGIWDLVNFSKASKKIFGSSSAISLLMPSVVDATEQGRTNILLVGYSADDPGHGGAKLTDSIMILSLDKDKKTGQMLSIPRDLYVDIPDYGSAKINEAYQAGEAKNGKPAEGVKLLQQVIEDSLGVETHYYAIIDYTTVKDVVDALGGIEVTIKSPDKRGLYDPNFRPKEGGPLKLKNGTQKIDGQTALRLTRARGSTYGSYGFPQSDFNRTQNQQQVLSAIQKELNWTLVLDPRTNGKIFDSVADNVKTDVKISEVLPLFRLFTSVPGGKMKNVTLNNINKTNFLTGYQTPSGQSALVPLAGVGNFEQIQEELKKLGF